MLDRYITCEEYIKRLREGCGRNLNTEMEETLGARIKEINENAENKKFTTDALEGDIQDIRAGMTGKTLDTLEERGLGRPRRKSRLVIVPESRETRHGKRGPGEWSAADYIRRDM